MENVTAHGYRVLVPEGTTNAELRDAIKLILSGIVEIPDRRDLAMTYRTFRLNPEELKKLLELCEERQVSVTEAIRIGLTGR